MSDTNEAAIVIGVDGSTTGMRTAIWAAAVAARFDAPLHVIHSLPTTGHHISDAAVTAIRAAAPEQQQDVATRVLARAEEVVRQHFPDVTISTETSWDTADHALVRASKSARLVVIGGDDVSPLAALLVGSTSLAVATRAACPVVVWREVHQLDDRPIVVGVDGTPAGSAAMAAAFDFAEHLGAPVRAVHAWSVKQSVDLTAIPHFIDWDEVADIEKRFVEDAVAPWRTRYPNVDVTCFAAQAKPGAALLAHGDGAQLIVVGNHWHSTLASVTLGSTSLNMLHHSKIPVMVCHAAPA